MSDKYSNDTIKQIYSEYYLAGFSVPNISQLVGISKSTLYKRFKALGLKTRDDSEKSIKCKFDDTYFENIDTDEKAYWLGFLCADGYILSERKYGRKKVGVSLAKIDEAHLYKFRNAIDGDMSIKTYRVTSGYKPGIEYVRLIVPSEKMAEDLISHGMVEHKSNILKRPSIDAQFYSHFIRGYFDGNGSIWRQRKNSGGVDQHHIGFTSTEDMLLFIIDSLIRSDVVGRRYPLRKRKPEQDVSSFKFGGNGNVRRFTDYIYANSAENTRLDRKYQKYLEFLSYINSRPYQ